MKSQFFEYYPFEEQEYKHLWETALIVFDTNVLLNWYRYSETTVDEYEKILEFFNSRLWLPYQIASEFHQERISVIFQQIKVHTDFIMKVDLLGEELSNESRNPFISKSLLSDYHEVMARVRVELQQKKDTLESFLSTDPFKMRITNFFLNKVGEKYSETQRKEIYSRGEKRFTEKIPPGYMDREKPSNERYGDLFIWLQMIDKAKESQLPIIFVTDDKKEDWWHIKDNRTLGPRLELRREFYEATKQHIYFYKPFKFLEYAYINSHLQVNSEVLQEVKSLKPIKRKRIFGDGRILLTICYKKVEQNSSVNKFLSLLAANGYDVSHKKVDQLEGKIVISVPNIEDLQRRIKNKFVNRLPEYGLELIDYTAEVLKSVE